MGRTGRSRVAMRNAGVAAWLAGLFLLLIGGCSSTSGGGTDSNTHWAKCNTVSDCLDSGARSECRDGYCVEPATGNGGASGMGGQSPASGAPNPGGNPNGGASAVPVTGGRTSAAGGAPVDAGHATGPAPDASAKDSGTDAAPGVDTSCVKSSDCTLVNATCCGVCGEPGANDKVAINKSGVDAWLASRCGDGSCPTCAQLAGPYEAMCDNGRCQMANLMQAKECLRDADCALRPKDCCACGALGRTAVTAINSSTSFPGCVVDCTSCPSGVQYPAGVTAHCVLSGGYCALE